MERQERATLQLNIPARTPLRDRKLIRLLRAAFQEYEHDYAGYFAGSIVYYAIVSLLPLLLLLLAALGLLLRLSDTAAEIEQQVLFVVQTHFGLKLRTTLEQLLQRLEQGSIIATAISLVGLMLGASKLFRHLRMTFRAIWRRAPFLTSGLKGAMRTTLLERAIAFGMVLAGGVLLLAALVLIAVLHWFASQLNDVPIFGGVIGWLIAALAPVLIIIATFGSLFLLLPPVRLQWRHVWLATALSTVAWFVGAEALTLYAVFFSNSFSAYGVVGAMLVLMLWMHATSKVLFFGAELCKVTFEGPIPHAS